VSPSDEGLFVHFNNLLNNLRWGVNVGSKGLKVGTIRAKGDILYVPESDQ